MSASPASCDFGEFQSLVSESQFIAGTIVAELDGPEDGFPCASHDDIIGHMSAYVASVMVSSFPLWLHHLSWANACMQSHGMAQRDVVRVFQVIGKHIVEPLGAQAYEMYDLGMNALPMLPLNTSCTPEPLQLHEALAKQYLDAMLAFDKSAAREVLRSQQLPLEDLYVHVVGPAMRRVGELWQNATINPAQEHFCTATTAELMAEFRAENEYKRDGRRLLAATIEGDDHDLGLRMVTDMFEYHGWIVQYLGANVPVKNLVSVAEDYDADVLAVSVTMTAQLPHVCQLAQAMKASGSKAKLLVGGQPMQLAPELERVLGVHGTARTPAAAVQVAREMLVAQALTP